MQQRTSNWLSFTCRIPRRLSIAVVLGLAGCGGGDGGWTRGNTPPSDAAAALSACNSETRAALNPDYGVDSDIIASRADDWRKAGIYSMATEQTRASNGARADRMVAECMAAKGFTQRTR
ncbi:MAG TPA: hypothetical protein VNT30_15535 [Stellaceae bacterium]|nr:hypothetical protein [Stellaceae bacterium]